MKIDVTYPPRRSAKFHRKHFIEWAKWPFLLAAIVCPIVNIATGGQAWSIIVLWSLWILWRTFFAIDLVEYNRVSSAVRLTINISVLLLLIDLFLVTGDWWAMQIIAIVCFSGMLLTGILFFSDIGKQRQNVMPLLLFILSSIVISVLAYFIFGQNTQWPFIVLWSVGATLFIVTGIVLRHDFIREFNKRLHT